MKRYVFETDGKFYVRVSKIAARKAYDDDLEIIFCACNMRPGSPWHPEVHIRNDGRSFDGVLHEFEYYNCSKATGLYATFYLPKESVEEW